MLQSMWYVIDKVGFYSMFAGYNISMIFYIYVAFALVVIVVKLWAVVHI